MVGASLRGVRHREKNRGAAEAHPTPAVRTQSCVFGFSRKSPNFQVRSRVCNMRYVAIRVACLLHIGCTLGRHPILFRFLHIGETPHFVSLFSSNFFRCRRLSQFLQISLLSFRGYYAIIVPFLGIDLRRRADTRGNHRQPVG